MFPQLARARARPFVAGLTVRNFGRMLVSLYKLIHIQGHPDAGHAGFRCHRSQVLREDANQLP